MNGEGLQHQDGHSHILSSTIPNCKSYDPAYGYELAVIIEHGLKEMYKDKKNYFYYITVTNERYVQPPKPKVRMLTATSLKECIGFLKLKNLR